MTQGLVGSPGRPGGNITGFSCMTAHLSGKRLELLKEALPGVSRLAVLRSAANANAQAAWTETEAAARILELQAQSAN